MSFPFAAAFVTALFVFSPLADAEDAVPATETPIEETTADTGDGIEKAEIDDNEMASVVAQAEGSAAAEDPYIAELSLEPKRGTIELPGGIAKLDVPRDFYYLSPEEADKVLQQWGNPPDNKTLGMIVPTDAGVGMDDSWAVVITYSDDGHVADDDAAEIDYDDLLKDMKSANEDENEARKEAGYEPVALVGWAEPPRYDTATHKFYWAKNLQFGEDSNGTLNYSVRVLGREGVLELNAVASMAQLSKVRREMPGVIEMASFKDGQRYEDFNDSTDRMAAYGLAALVAGGVAAKVGLWAKFVALLLAAKKFIVFILVAIGAAAKQFFGRKDKNSTSA